MYAVIKLKQIEHIRNERNALAGVAGHPFITTLVTSFADRESLYMLVLFLKESPSSNNTDMPSLILSREERSSPTCGG